MAVDAVSASPLMEIAAVMASTVPPSGMAIFAPKGDFEFRPALVRKPTRVTSPAPSRCTMVACSCWLLGKGHVLTSGNGYDCAICVLGQKIIPFKKISGEAIALPHSSKSARAEHSGHVGKLMAGFLAAAAGNYTHNQHKGWAPDRPEQAWG